MNDIAPMSTKSNATAIFGGVLSAQRSWRCRDFEMRYIQCLEAYGVNRLGLDRCGDYKRDFWECSKANRSRERVVTIQQERKKQYRLEGKERYAKESLDGTYWHAKPVD